MVRKSIQNEIEDVAKSMIEILVYFVTLCVIMSSESKYCIWVCTVGCCQELIIFSY